MKDRTNHPAGALHPNDNVHPVPVLASDENIPQPVAARTGRKLPDDWYTTAARAEHDRHCANCRALTAASDAAEAENAESMARRDRRQLGLHIGRGKAVSV